MKDDRFDDLLKKLAEAPLPECPGSLENNVLRRIRQGADAPSLSDWMLGLFPRSEFIFAALAMTVAVSLGSTVVATRLHADASQATRVASKALDFEVFQSNDFFDLHN